MQDPIVQAKIKLKMLSKYGVISYTKTAEYKS
nr:MAG TPA: hypothetical protein [Caudoviricetes sp.]